MKKTAPVLFISSLLTMLALFVAPSQAAAYTAKGITNATGLAYDDVYGVVNDRAIMKSNNGSIDLVDSNGAVKRATKNGTGWYINDAPSWNNPLESALATFGNGYITLSNTVTDNGGLFTCGLADATTGDDLITLNKTTADIAVSPDGSRYVVADYFQNTVKLSLYKGHSSTLLDTIEIMGTTEAAVEWTNSANEFKATIRFIEDGGNHTDEDLEDHYYTIDGDKLKEIKDPESAKTMVQGKNHKGESFTVTTSAATKLTSITYNGTTTTLPSKYSEVNVQGDYIFTTDAQTLIKECFDYSGDKVTLFKSYRSVVAFPGAQKYLCHIYEPVNSRYVHRFLVLSYDGKQIASVSNDDVSYDPIEGAKLTACGSYAQLDYTDGYYWYSALIDNTGAVLVTGYQNITLADGYIVAVVDSGSQYATSYVFTADTLKPIGSVESCESLAPVTVNNKTYFVANPIDTETSAVIAHVYDPQNGLNPLTIDTYSVATMKTATYRMSNSPYNSTAKAWWAQDSRGFWGLVKDDGTVIVPFKYSDYCDLNLSDSKVLVKSSDKWWFYDTTETSNPNPDPTPDPTPEPSPDPNPNPNPQPQPSPDQNGLRRIFGQTRYQTMAALVEKGEWKQGGTAIVASGANFPDALSASSLAGLLDAPVILTESSSLSTEASTELQNLAPTKVYVIGGESAISASTNKQIQNITGKKCTVERIAGQTRYETCMKIASHPAFKQAKTVIIVTGTNYADALSISPYAYKKGYPILLCDPVKGLTNEEFDFVHEMCYDYAILVGGTSAVPQHVETQLKWLALNDHIRLSGATRFETSAEILDFETRTTSLKTDGVFLATGKNFPDALAAGPVAAKKGTSLLLVDPGMQTTCKTLGEYMDSISNAYIVGGTAVIPQNDVQTLAKALGLNVL